MKKAIIGTILCLFALLMLQKNRILPGLFLFIGGIILMYADKWPRR